MNTFSSRLYLDPGRLTARAIPSESNDQLNSLDDLIKLAYQSFRRPSSVEILTPELTQRMIKIVNDNTAEITRFLSTTSGYEISPLTAFIKGFCSYKIPKTDGAIKVLNTICNNISGEFSRRLLYKRTDQSSQSSIMALAAAIGDCYQNFNLNDSQKSTIAGELISLQRRFIAI